MNTERERKEEILPSLKKKERRKGRKESRELWSGGKRRQIGATCFSLERTQRYRGLSGIHRDEKQSIGEKRQTKMTPLCSPFSLQRERPRTSLRLMEVN